MKTCIHCLKEFEESFFLKGRSVCVECRKIQGKNSYQKRRERIEQKTGTRICKDCNIEKDAKEFTNVVSSCNECQKEKRKINRDKNKEPKEYQKVKCPEGYKLCKECFIVKLEEEFRPKRNKCKKCCNKERVAYKKGEITKQPEVEKNEEDEFMKRIKASCRIRIRETLPKKELERVTTDNRFGYIYEYLGCQMTFLKKWFEFNYDEKMNEENYGSYWNIDHVIPIKTFDIINDLEKHKKSCYSWYNLSPFVSKENNSKSTNIDKTQLQTHLDKLTSFCEKEEIKIDTEYLQLCAKHLDAGNP